MRKIIMTKPTANSDRFHKCVVLNDREIHLTDLWRENPSELTLCAKPVAYTTNTPLNLSLLCENCRNAMRRVILSGLK